MTEKRRDMARVLRADARALPLPDGSVSAIVCDPPYGLEFMGRGWDRLGAGVEPTARSAGGAEDAPGAGNPYSRSRIRYGSSAAAMQAWHEAWGLEALRVLKPGGHLVAFGGTRTFHRLACGLEDAGLEIRDCLMWLHGQGFPKSLDVSKALDREAGAEREIVGLGSRECEHIRRGVLCPGHGDAGQSQSGATVHVPITAPATEAARAWTGWGTALKPAWEPIILARKPIEGTVASNVLDHGTGALHIEAGRIGSDVETWPSSRRNGAGEGRTCARGSGAPELSAPTGPAPPGRWPPNLVLSHLEDCEPLGLERIESDSKGRAGGRRGGGSSYGAFAGFEDPPEIGYADTAGMETIASWRCAPGCPVAMLDAQAGDRPAGGHPDRRRGDRERLAYGAFRGDLNERGGVGRTAGVASRFFYCPKASRPEREAGLEGFPAELVQSGIAGDMPVDDLGEPRERFKVRARNQHPTVKPIELMRWLIRLVAPPGGLVIDPFLGSGTTGCAAVLEGLPFLGLELDPDDEGWLEIAAARMDHWRRRGDAPTDRGPRTYTSKDPGQVELFR